MSTLVLTRGLPGSGKTTWAKQWQAAEPGRRARFSRDELRAHLAGPDHPGVLGHKLEELVTSLHQAQVRLALEAGLDVCVDDTNLRAKVSRGWADLAAAVGADLQVQDFLDVDVDTCIDRVRRRWSCGRRNVPADVIRDMHTRYLSSGPLPPVTASPERTQSGLVARYEPDRTLPAAWIVDIDGTLARMVDRGPFDWHRVGEDEPVEAVVATVRALSRDHDIIVMSGRDGSCREQTEDWLDAHRIPFDDLHMRAAGDMRKDAIVKGELFDAHVRSRFHVLGVLDDRDQVVALWRGIGLPCFQVAPGRVLTRTATRTPSRTTDGHVPDVTAVWVTATR